jgi:hypothetical protein
MADKTYLPYDVWVEDALSSVIHRTLKYVSENGMPEGHHFYITFRTKDPGINMAEELRQNHPGEMTIVLQHQYEDLDVNEEFISVTLYFHGKPEKMVIPFSAVTAFADPYVDFGLELKLTNIEGRNVEHKLISDESPSGSIAKDSDSWRTGSDKKKQGKVIALDAFRKKT